MKKDGISSGNSRAAFLKLKKYLLIGVGVLFLFVVSFYLYIAYFLPLPSELTANPDIPTTKIFDRNGVVLYEVLKPELGKKTFILLSEMPDYLVSATIAAEDTNYYNHPGVDFWAIGRALFYNVREGRVVSGASTITQQLVRNMLGISVDRGYSDKILEAMYSVRISHIYNKDEILELYLNKIYYGNMSYGIESASKGYFGKVIGNLDLAECAFLAGLPQSPSRYNPYINFDAAKKRQKYVLDQMVAGGYVDAAEAEAAFDEPLKLRSDKYDIKAPHFVHYVINQLEELYGEDAVLNGGLSVTTTLDYDLQIVAEEAIDRHIERLIDHNVNNGSLISMDLANNQILAWVGSANYFDEEIDGAVNMVTALRQPGSSIKPLTYLAAFEKGYSPATIIFDIPTQFATETGPYSPKNYDLDFHGPVRVRTALASSYNIPAVKTLEYVGVNAFISFLSRLGVDSLSNSAEFYGLALTLGGGEVRLVDMAEAFSVIAHYGEKVDYSSIISIENYKGEKLMTWQKPNSRYVLGTEGRQHAYQIMDILSDKDARIPGFGEGGVLEISHTAAVKTGTTRNFRDNWTMGFSPVLLTGVWVGNADGSEMKNVSGVDGAAPIWADFMESALEFKPDTAFSIPSGLSEVELCAISGLLPDENCKERIYEVLTQAQIPTETDNYYQNFHINDENGKIVPEECVGLHNPASIREKILPAYPAELQKWAVSKGLSLPEYEYCALSKVPNTEYPSGYSNGQATAVIIDNPANNDEFLIDYSLPIQSQRIPFRVTVPGETTSVRFYLDNELVGETNEKPFTYMWDTKSGRFELKVEAELSSGEKIESGSIFFAVL